MTEITLTRTFGIHVFFSRSMMVSFFSGVMEFALRLAINSWSVWSIWANCALSSWLALCSAICSVIWEGADADAENPMPPPLAIPTIPGPPGAPTPIAPTVVTFTENWNCAGLLRMESKIVSIRCTASSLFILVHLSFLFRKAKMGQATFSNPFMLSRKVAYPIFVLLT